MIPAVIAAVALASQNAPPPVAAPPQPAGRPQLMDRPQLRPSRAGEARENYGRDPEEAKKAEADALAAVQAAEAEEAAARAAVAAADQPPAAPAQRTAPSDPVPMAPSAVAGISQTAGTPAVAAARPRRAMPNLAPLAAIAMLFAPALGVIWMMSRPGPVPSE